MYHGIINVYKEKGFTSHDVVARLRGICKQKRIGHTGTLDPDAVGVLPVCLGSATRLCDILTEKDKEYVAVLRLGITTDTQDLTGKALSQTEVFSDRQEAERAILGFAGEQLQIPPMYSALKVNGRKLCDLARQGKEVERAPRPVTIHRIEILEENMPEFTIRVCCSKGTYIRTLCHDIGQKLGCGAALASLVRTRSGSFVIEEAYTLDQIQELADQGRLSEAVTAVEKMFESLPAAAVKREALKALQNGNQLKEAELVFQKESGGPKPDCEVRLCDPDGKFYGIYRYDKEREIFRPVKMFFTE